MKPAVVVLIFCTDNDRQDNSSNIRYEGYQKPYFATAPDGSLLLSGQPVPKSRLQAMKEDWWVRHSWLIAAGQRGLSQAPPPGAAGAGPDRAAGRQDQAVRGSERRQFLVGLQPMMPR